MASAAGSEWVVHRRPPPDHSPSHSHSHSPPAQNPEPNFTQRSRGHKNTALVIKFWWNLLVIRRWSLRKQGSWVSMGEVRGVCGGGASRRGRGGGCGKAGGAMVAARLNHSISVFLLREGHQGQSLL
ncbi:hypothetical protein E2C01_087084 [Portunus trituberculatus]|uniref:Uncharacterized protein n=1 Tax=Portunus trituberculatus TaxID=210409 RepID=A0A5B7JD47_PORTR|nr:hypothetical protein [Portunus trituberculatus]